VFWLKEIEPLLQVANSKPTSAIDQPPRRLADRSLIRSLAISAAAIMLVFSAPHMLQQPGAFHFPTVATVTQNVSRCSS
jgi:hypothetical protein